MSLEVSTLSPMQTARKVVLLVLILAFFGALCLVATPLSWSIHEAVEKVGYGLIGACIFGRCWCTLFIGGRKGAELVDIGPYSLCRNPLYFFSFVGAAGMGAQTGSMTVAAVFVLIAWVVFRLVVGREERFLIQALGEPYRRYMATTPRFLPNPRLWRSAEIVEVRPNRVALTFFDGLAFLLAIPLAEGLEILQRNGTIPVLLHLP